MARTMFYPKVVVDKMSFFIPDFCGVSLILYLLNSVKKEVEEIRQRRDQRIISDNFRVNDADEARN